MQCSTLVKAPASEGAAVSPSEDILQHLKGWRCSVVTELASPSTPIYQRRSQRRTLCIQGCWKTLCQRIKRTSQPNRLAAQETPPSSIRALFDRLPAKGACPHLASAGPAYLIVAARRKHTSAWIVQAYYALGRFLLVLVQLAEILAVHRLSTHGW